MRRPEQHTEGTEILVAAPFRRDADFVLEALDTFADGTGQTRSIAGGEELPQPKGRTVLLVATQEALTRPFLGHLEAWLERQPQWLRVPVILLLDEGHSADAAIGDLQTRLFRAELTFLFRPCYLLEFRSVVERNLALLTQQRSIRDLLDAERAMRAETDHRMKNQLSTVLALYHLSRTQSGTLEEFDESFGRRIRSLGDVHDLLRQSSDHSVGFFALCRAIMAPYQDESGNRFRIVGTDFSIASEAALSLSLMLNELATNSAKYGAYAASGGSVGVEVTEESADRIFVAWQERDGPEVRPPSATSYGTSFILASARMLGGSAEFHYHEAGLAVQVSLSRQRVSNR